MQAVLSSMFDTSLMRFLALPPLIYLDVSGGRARLCLSLLLALLDPPPPLRLRLRLALSRQVMMLHDKHGRDPGGDAEAGGDVERDAEARDVAGGDGGELGWGDGQAAGGDQCRVGQDPGGDVGGKALSRDGLVERVVAVPPDRLSWARGGDGRETDMTEEEMATPRVPESIRMKLRVDVVTAMSLFAAAAWAPTSEVWNVMPAPTPWRMR